MGALDVTCKDYFKQPYVIASLAETVLFQKRLLIHPEDVRLIDTVDAKINEADDTYTDLYYDITM